MTFPDPRTLEWRRRAASTVALLVIVIAASACGTTAALSTPAGQVVTPSPVATVATVGPTATTGAVATPWQATATPDSAFAPTGQTTEATVVRVVDGDTIVVAYGGKQYKVRYIGMNTPETVDPSRPIQWMGPEASAANKALVTGRTVVLEKDVSETDRYGRLLRYVWLTDGAAWTLVNLALIKQGFASVSTYPPDVKYVDVYVAAERVAQAGAAGLWGEAPTADPTAAPTANSTPKATTARSVTRRTTRACRSSAIWIARRSGRWARRRLRSRDRMTIAWTAMATASAASRGAGRGAPSGDDGLDSSGRAADGDVRHASDAGNHGSDPVADGDMDERIDCEHRPENCAHRDHEISRHPGPLAVTPLGPDWSGSGYPE